MLESTSLERVALSGAGEVGRREDSTGHTKAETDQTRQITSTRPEMVVAREKRNKIALL